MSTVEHLIVTEKNNVAERIATILSDETASTEDVGGVKVYGWGGTRCMGLSGHVVKLDFPERYSDWNHVEPAELVDAPVETKASQERLVAALRRMARRSRQVTIATDYDREGELIGKEAYDIIGDVDPEMEVRRVRFSSITAPEVTAAFEADDELDFALAEAGEARQIIDLVWGAALTRYLSLTSGRRGTDFVSVGRVQGPTLRLIVDREREIEAFVPDPYWEITATIGEAEPFEADLYVTGDGGSEQTRIWDEREAEAAFETLQEADEAIVDEVDKSVRTDRPPAPFNTTQFIRAAGGIGYSASRAMGLAEALYTAGYITYPRTDNTVYPEDLDPPSHIKEFAEHPTFSDAVEYLQENTPLSPTRGDKETTDHPPIYPTGEIPGPTDLAELDEEDGDGEAHWEVYELVVRRFFATLAPPAKWERLRIDLSAAGEDATVRLKANGRRLLEPGYHTVYPYSNRSEAIVPDLTAQAALPIGERTLADKETQPPGRRGQSRLIETMEELGIGTKATRHNVIETLYKRKYIEENPPRPTQLARAVVDAAEAYAEQIISAEMTAQLEADMAAIAAGERTLEEVTAESKALLTEVFDTLHAEGDAIGAHIKRSLKADRTVGPCPESDHDLVIRKAGNGSYFIGCDGYPACDFTYPLPNGGRPITTETVCPEHDLAEIKLLAGRGTTIHGCAACKAEEAEAIADRPIGPCPECGKTDAGELAIKVLRSGSRLAGCDRYPECDYAVPLPRRGEIEVVDEMCDEHELPEVQVVTDDGREPWELGCPICNAAELDARRTGASDDAADEEDDSGEFEELTEQIISATEEI
ncbi:UNVERIFIED_CONTAM: DNA topoisomerase I [Euhalothece sp. KZN 001]